MSFIFLAIVIGLLPAYIAKNKGKSFVVWWVYGSLLFIVALPHSLLMKEDYEAIELNKIKSGGKKCSYCAEIVKREATVCRYCQQELN